MERIISQFSDKQRIEMFTNTAANKGINTAMIEKDFWVYIILDKIFSDGELSQILCFKGGTSLSKVFGVIDRFSEDIDLILLPDVILKDNENLIQSSKNQQNKFNKEIEIRAENYISTVLKNKIASVLGNQLNVMTDEEYKNGSEKFDNHILHVIYPKVIDSDEYLRPEIKLEIGPLALWNPHEIYQLSSYVAQAYPRLQIPSTNVPTVMAERTFWGKATILHAEHHRKETKKLPARYARHYYDVFKLGNSNIKEQAFQKLDLLSEVVEFKKRFYNNSWANYDTACTGTIKLTPSEHHIDTLKKDYAETQNMIFGTYPSWEELIDYLSTLEKEINNL